MSIRMRAHHFAKELAVVGVMISFYGGLAAWVGFNSYIVVTGEVGMHDPDWVQMLTTGKLVAWTIVLIFAVRGLINRVKATGISILWPSLYLVLIYNFIVILQFANAYKHLGLYEDGNRINDGPSSIYFSVVTWTTLGFGDLTPTHDARFFAAFEALYGYSSMAILVGLLLWVLTGNQAKS